MGKPPRGKPKRPPKRNLNRRKRRLPKSRRPSSPLSPPTRLRLPRPNKLRVYSLFCIPNQSQSLSEFTLLSKQNSSFRIVPYWRRRLTDDHRMRETEDYFLVILGRELKYKKMQGFLSPSLRSVINVIYYTKTLESQTNIIPSMKNRPHQIN